MRTEIDLYLDLALTFAAMFCAYQAGKLKGPDPRRGGYWLIGAVGLAILALIF